MLLFYFANVDAVFLDDSKHDNDSKTHYISETNLRREIKLSYEKSGFFLEVEQIMFR